MSLLHRVIPHALGAAALVLAGALPPPAAAAGGPRPPPHRAFEQKGRPVLARHCYSCHGPARQKNGLRLDSRAAILQGGTSGPAITPGKPEESLLIRALGHGGPVQ